MNKPTYDRVHQGVSEHTPVKTDFRHDDKVNAIKSSENRSRFPTDEPHPRYQSTTLSARYYDAQ